MEAQRINFLTKGSNLVHIKVLIFHLCSWLLPDRPESSLTVTSECSSTISSEEEPGDVTHIENSAANLRKASQQKANNGLNGAEKSSRRDANDDDDVDVEIPPTSPTGSSISDDMNWPAPPPPLTSADATQAGERRAFSLHCNFPAILYSSIKFSHSRAVKYDYANCNGQSY